MSALLENELDDLVGWADELVPGDASWPRPSDAGIRVFFERVFRNETDAGRVRRALSELAERSGDAALDRRATLERLEREEPLVFRALLEFVYFGYYSRPLVVAAINRNLGCEYVSPPQPFGYVMTRDGDPQPSARGSYTPTDAVVRVDLAALRAAHAGNGDGGEAIRPGANPRFGNSATLFT